MIKLVLALILCVVSAFAPNGNAADVAEIRTIDGTYYDYMVIETIDGHEWLLEDAREHLVWNAELNDYVPFYFDGQKVRVTFDCKGTEAVYDDEILVVCAAI